MKGSSADSRVGNGDLPKSEVPVVNTGDRIQAGKPSGK